MVRETRAVTAALRAHRRAHQGTRTDTSSSPSTVSGRSTRHEDRLPQSRTTDARRPIVRRRKDVPVRVFLGPHGLHRERHCRCRRHHGRIVAASSAVRCASACTAASPGLRTSEMQVVTLDREGRSAR